MIIKIGNVELPPDYGEGQRLLRRIYEEQEGVRPSTEKDRETKEATWGAYDPYWEMLWGKDDDS